MPLVLLLLLTLFLPSSVTAGTNKLLPGFSIASYGAGINTQLRNTYILKNRKPAPAFRAAFVLQYQARKHFGLRTELGYALKGRKYSLGSYEFNQQLHYVGISLLAEPAIGKKVKVGLPFGPAINFLAKAKLQTSESLFPTSDNTTDYKRMEVAWVNGLNVCIPMEQFADFKVGFRNEIGLTGIYRNFSDKKNNPLNYQFSLTFDLLFHLKPKS